MIVDTSSSMSNIKTIQEQFNAVIAYSQEYPGVYSNELFEQWFEAKRDFIEAWGGKLILELPEPVIFELSQKDKDTRLDDFINNVAIAFDNEPLANFIEMHRKGFFSNMVTEDSEYQGNKIPKGMKLLKAFKFFENDEGTLKDIQTQASMIIQEDKVEGILCFSVHPLDFLSTSENTYNWRSCHALDGEYRAGNLSYMVDSSTIICYLRGANDVNLPNFPDNIKWNSKKWRMLLFFSEHWDVLFAGRQYPFFSRNALNEVLNALKPYLGSSHWTQWHDDQLNQFTYKDRDSYADGHLYFKYVCIDGQFNKLTDIVQDREGSLHFNDLLRSSCYKPYYIWKKYRSISDVPEPPILKIGGSVPCLRCGKDHIVTTDTMMCLDCELEYGESQSDLFGRCDCCDRRMLMDRSYYIASHEQTVCEWCYDSYIKRCNNCGDIFYSEDMIYDKVKHDYICTYCAAPARNSFWGIYYK